VRRKVPAVEGAVELVRELSTAGVPLAIGSAGPRANIDLIVEGMGVQRHFAAIVSADDVTRGKPDPQVFQLACERLGMPPSQCVVIEDAPPGVVAGKRAGASVAAIMMHHSRETLAESGADLVVSKLKDLSVEALRKLVAA
jgi:beta-phosphoglucomutase